MPVEDDYMMVIIPCIAEIAVSDTPERVKKLRLGAVSELQRYLHYYRQLGYMPKLLYAIADKKCRMIGSATTKAEMQKLIRPNCPHYDSRIYPGCLQCPGGRTHLLERNIPERAADRRGLSAVYGAF